MVSCGSRLLFWTTLYFVASVVLDRRGCCGMIALGWTGFLYWPG